MNRYGVIMAGGGGTRFWPLSRQKTPKQLLNLSGKGLMVNEAVDRIATVVPTQNIFIVTAEVQAEAMKTATYGKVLTENILAEPVARNTAACIGYAAMEIYRKHGDGVMIITPADHYIKDVPALTKIFSTAVSVAEHEDKLVTVGICPTFPSSGFGYIRYENTAVGEVKSVVNFKEKPDEKTAKKYLESGEYLWNSGMFIWKASLILKKLNEYAPDIYEQIEIIGDAMNTPQEQKVLHDIFPRIRKISIDYAVMEPCASKGDVLVVPGDCGWNDVGSWDMMNILHTIDKQGNILVGDVTAIDISDCMVFSTSRKTAVLGIHDLVVVETPDAVMICPRERAQDVRKLVDEIEKSERFELL